VIGEVGKRSKRYDRIPQRFYILAESAQEKEFLEDACQKYRRNLQSELRELKPTVPKLSELVHNAITSGLIGYILGSMAGPEAALVGALVSGVLGITSILSLREVYRRGKRRRLSSQLESLSELEIAILSEKPNSD
jgi:Flp pilus assembly protein TadB